MLMLKRSIECATYISLRTVTYVFNESIELCIFLAQQITTKSNFRCFEKPGPAMYKGKSTCHVIVTKRPDMCKRKSALRVVTVVYLTLTTC